MAARTGMAVFGIGRMGLEHVKNIITSPRAALQWIVTENVEDAVTLRRQFDLGVKITTPDNVDQALDDASVDAVLISSPTATHEPLLQKSLNAEKAVLCEKPLTSSVESTRAAYDLAAAKNKPLLCAFNRRFDPSMSRVHDGVRSGKHGPVRIVKSTSRDYPFPPLEYLKTSSGIFSDSTIHDLDLCSWMVGAKPRTVFAQGVVFNPELAKFGDCEQVAVVITYENGAVTVIDNGRWAPFGHDTRIEVLCERALLSVGNKMVDEVHVHSEECSVAPPIEEDFLFRYRQAYRNELEHFLDVVEDKAETLVTKADTLQAMRLSELCRQSFREQKVVPFSE